MAGVTGMKHKKLKYSTRLGRRICELMEQGHTLVEVCKLMAPLDIEPSNILSWRRDSSEFDEMYSIAKDSRTELWVDQMYELASSPIEDSLELAQRKMKIDVLKTLYNRHKAKEDKKIVKEGKTEYNFSIPNLDE